MKEQTEKCVILIDESLPVGLACNTAAILAMSLGKQHPELVGVDVTDKNKKIHKGIIEFPLPILKGDSNGIKNLLIQLEKDEFQDITAVDFFDLAQSCKTYEEYIEKMKNADCQNFQYFGIGLCGPKKKINKLTGSMPLLR